LLDRDGVLVIVGGKLTTYRRMAQDAVDRACSMLGRDSSCKTATLPLVGASARPAADAPRLRRRFGAEADAVAALGSSEPLAAGVPALRNEVAWALRAEGALTVEDVIDRRLRLDLVPSWRAASLSHVEELIAAVG
jgi:glycerol-3-phosphate dehydrogenase